MTELNQSDLRLAKNFALTWDCTQEELDAARRIIAAIPDPAPLSMAEIKWDNGQHYLAEAEKPDFGKVIMIAPSGARFILTLSAEDGAVLRNIPANLTPTGRKYKIVPEGEACPELPKGMRLADHKEHGRVVASPWVDGDEDYKIFLLDDSCRGGAGYDFASESELTFVDAEPS